MNKNMFFPFDPNNPNNPKIIAARNEYRNPATVGLDLDHEASKGKLALMVWWTPNSRDPFLQSMNTGQIYVRGHGNPGIDAIEGGRGGEHVDCRTIVDRLVSGGLPKAYTGKIKMYNCHSAEVGQAFIGGYRNMMPGYIGVPLGQLIADEMFQRGYRACTFYGYVGSIDTMRKREAEGFHHYVREVVPTGEPGVSRQAATRRASAARVQFLPRRTVSTVFKSLLNTRLA